MWLKFIAGILYARAKFSPDLIMRVDADDYVNVNLAKYSYETLVELSDKQAIDGYLIDKGAQIEMSASPDNKIIYGKTFLVKKFNSSCGTCRVFRKEALYKKISDMHPDILEKTDDWFSGVRGNCLIFPPNVLDWLDEISKDNYAEEWHPVNILGRHINQKPYFSFELLPFVGAAKACGHGNHDGPREGKIHEDKIICQLPFIFFKKNFGVSRPSPLFSLISSLYFKLMFKLN